MRFISCFKDTQFHFSIANTCFNPCNAFVTHIDVDECANENGLCDHHCENTGGSRACHCREGYTLGVDGASCTGKTFSVFCSYSYFKLSTVN